MKNKKLYGLVGVGALAVVGGTFAYYNASQTFVNPFKTSNYSTVATERFNPTGDAHDWEPGEKIDKKVMATNTGQGTVWVRVKLDEDWKWTMPDGTVVTKELLMDGRFENDAKFLPANADEAVDQFSQFDGLTVDDGSVVYKEMNYVSNKWLMEEAVAAGKDTWYYVDGYFYYTKPLAKDESTETALLESVTLCKDTDMGYFRNFAGFTQADENSEPKSVVPSQDVINGFEYDKDGNITDTVKNVGGWYVMGVDEALPMTADGEVVKGKGSSEVYPLSDGNSFFTYKANLLDANRPGYSNADYSLNITVEFVQADEEAAQSFPEGAWAWWPGKDATTESGAEGNVTE